MCLLYFAYPILKLNYRNFANNSSVILAKPTKQLDKESLPSLHITSFCLEKIHFSKKKCPKQQKTLHKSREGTLPRVFLGLGGSEGSVPCGFSVTAATAGKLWALESEDFRWSKGLGKSMENPGDDHISYICSYTQKVQVDQTLPRGRIGNSSRGSS